MNQSLRITFAFLLLNSVVAAGDSRVVEKNILTDSTGVLSYLRTDIGTDRPSSIEIWWTPKGGIRELIYHRSDQLGGAVANPHLAAWEGQELALTLLTPSGALGYERLARRAGKWEVVARSSLELPPDLNGIYMDDSRTIRLGRHKAPDAVWTITDESLVPNSRWPEVKRALINGKPYWPLDILGTEYPPPGFKWKRPFPTTGEYEPAENPFPKGAGKIPASSASSQTSPTQAQVGAPKPVELAEPKPDPVASPAATAGKSEAGLSLNRLVGSVVVLAAIGLLWLVLKWRRKSSRVES